MKKGVINSLLFSLLCFCAAGQGVSYDLKAVPEPVKNKASVITHLEDTNLEVESLDKMTLSVHRIFTVVNEEGKAELVFTQNTSKYLSLEEAEIKVYDAAGKQIGKYKKKDMITMATGEGLIDDGFVTGYRVTTTSYPITLDIKYELKIKSTLHFPDYRFITRKEGVVESNYTAKVPADLGLRYKPEHTSIQPVITEDGKYKIYKWSVKNLSPIEYEEGALGSMDRYPHVMIVSDKFSHYGFEGDLSSWKSFGEWINKLYNGLDVLPPDRQQFFLQMVKDAPDDREKIRRIYGYMQKNFRYVSIQLGIGGLKPFPADFTDKKKYGDCKGLSNYMKAALKTVGIKSHVAIINAEYDQEPVDPGFPNNGFDHVILCVPEPKDSIWLECTSSTAEFAELGTFTENRNALLITDEGGVLVPTPRSQSASNTISSFTTVNLDADLSAITETAFTSKGAYKEMLNDLMDEKKDDQKRAILYYFGPKQPDDFELVKTDPSDDHKSRLKMVISKLPGFVSGSKLFIGPRIYKLWSINLPKADNRKLDFYFQFPFEKTDTTVFKFPAGMKLDAMPNANEFKCDYASYKSKYWYNDKENAIYSVTTLVLKQHKIPAADYAAVKKFFDNVLQDDSQKMVMQKGDAEKKAF